MKGVVAVLVVLAALSGVACEKGTSATKGEKTGEIPDRRIERLRKLIALPATPAEVGFEVVPRGTPGGLGPTDYFLVAVLRFEHGELPRLAARARERSDARISPSSRS